MVIARSTKCDTTRPEKEKDIDLTDDVITRGFVHSVKGTRLLVSTKKWWVANVPRTNALLILHERKLTSQGHGLASRTAYLKKIQFIPASRWHHWRRWSCDIPRAGIRTSPFHVGCAQGPAGVSVPSDSWLNFHSLVVLTALIRIRRPADRTGRGPRMLGLLLTSTASTFLWDTPWHGQRIPLQT